MEIGKAFLPGFIISDGLSLDTNTMPITSWVWFNWDAQLFYFGFLEMGLKQDGVLNAK